MNTRESAALDRYITGNYGEDQFRKASRDPKYPKWSAMWIQFASDEQLTKALGQAEGNAAYFGDEMRQRSKFCVKRHFFWAQRAEAIKAQLQSRSLETDV